MLPWKHKTVQWNLSVGAIVIATTVSGGSVWLAILLTVH